MPTWTAHKPERRISQSEMRKLAIAVAYQCDTCSGYYLVPEASSIMGGEPMPSIICMWTHDFGRTCCHFGDIEIMDDETARM